MTQSYQLICLFHKIWFPFSELLCLYFYCIRHIMHLDKDVMKNVVSDKSSGNWMKFSFTLKTSSCDIPLNSDISSNWGALLKGMSAGGVCAGGVLHSSFRNWGGEVVRILAVEYCAPDSTGPGRQSPEEDASWKTWSRIRCLLEDYHFQETAPWRIPLLE